MHEPRHLLVNGLSVGTGGGYTVARGIVRHLGIVRPAWRVTLALSDGVPLHERMRLEWMPENVSLHFAPPATRGLLRRTLYERRGLRRWAIEQGVDAVLQLNGIVVPGMPAPTIAHFQDPWPYRPQAWARRRDRLVAAAKRRAFARSIRRAAWCGFTSDYLRRLIVGPRAPRTSVFFNGLPRAFAEHLEEPLDDWSQRPLELLTVSDVADYKRQWLVIRALPRLRRMPGLGGLVYRIIGRCDDAQRARLTGLAAQVGVANAVHVEGRQPDEVVRAAFRSARCYALMSVCESFGLPAIEAMSSGTPVVTADCCAIPEVCGGAAELVAVDDVDALVTAVARVLLDPARAGRLREAGRDRVRRFDWHDTAEQIARAVQQVAPPGGRRAPMPARADAGPSRASGGLVALQGARG